MIGVSCRYGVGYHMTIVKEPSCVSSEVERLVKSFVPSAEMVTNVGAELSFILPSCAVTQFPLLFDEMECEFFLMYPSLSVSLLRKYLQVFTAVITVGDSLKWLKLYKTLTHRSPK